jgi:hypothetical protein
MDGEEVSYLMWKPCNKGKEEIAVLQHCCMSYMWTLWRNERKRLMWKEAMLTTSWWIRWQQQSSIRQPTLTFSLETWRQLVGWWPRMRHGPWCGQFKQRNVWLPSPSHNRKRDQRTECWLLGKFIWKQADRHRHHKCGPLTQLHSKLIFQSNSHNY